MTTEHESPLDFPLPDGGVAEPPQKPAKEGGVLLGVGLALAMNIVAVLISWAFEGELMLVFIGLIQLAYLVPAWIVLRVKGMKRTALGVVILAAVVFLLNSACWGIGLVLFSGLH